MQRSSSLLLLVAVVALGAGCDRGASSGPPNLLLITLHTLRADHLDRLYDLRRDPHEQHDVLDAHPEVVDGLLRELRRRVAEEEARAVVPVEKTMPSHIREQLRALGYVE